MPKEKQLVVGREVPRPHRDHAVSPGVAPNDLASLREQLARCSSQYLVGDLDGQRLAVTNALVGIAQFLEAQDFPPQAILLVMRPAIALAEREQSSALDQMFIQRRREGRPSRTFDQQMRTAILAALADFWLRLNSEDERTQRSKLADAARKMRGPWFGQISGAALKTAKETVSAEATGELTREFYESFSRFIDQTAAVVGPMQAFPLMVRYINEHPVSSLMGILKTLPVSPLDAE